MNISVPFSTNFNFKSTNSSALTTTAQSIGTRTAGNTLIVFADAASLNTGPDITAVTLTDASHTDAALTLDYHPAAVLQNVNNDRISVWRFSNIAGGASSLKFTMGATPGAAINQSFCDAVVFEIADLDISPLDTALSAVDHATAAQATLTLTAAAPLAMPNEIALAYCVDPAFDNKYATTSTGWATTDPAVAAAANGNGFGSSHQIYSSLDTPAITFTGSGGSATGWPYGVIVAYKASSGPFYPTVTANTTSGTGSAGAAISPSLSGLTLGNFVVLLVAQNSGTVSVPTPAGYTAVPSTANIQNPTGTTDDRAIAAFTKQITSTTETASLTTTGKYEWTMFEVTQTSGPRATSGSTGQVTTAGANPTINSGAGVLTNDLLISYVATMTASSTFTAGTGYTAVPTAAPATTNVSTRTESKTATAGGATAAPFVNASTTLWSELAFAMAPFVPQPNRPILQAIIRASLW